VLLHIFVETVIDFIFQDSLMNRKFIIKFKFVKFYCHLKKKKILHCPNLYIWYMY